MDLHSTGPRDERQCGGTGGLGGRRVEEPAGRGSDRRGGWSRPPQHATAAACSAAPSYKKKEGAAKGPQIVGGDASPSPVRDAPQNEHTRLVAAREKPRPLRNALLDGPDTRPI